MNKLELKDNGEFLEIFVSGEKKGLASKTRPLAHIVRSIYHLLGSIDPSINFDIIEYEVKKVLAQKENKDNEQ
jgi:hypothetical protein